MNALKISWKNLVNVFQVSFRSDHIGALQGTHTREIPITGRMDHRLTCAIATTKNLF